MKRKIPNYKDKVLTIEDKKKLKRKYWLIAKNLFKKLEGGKKQDGK